MTNKSRTLGVLAAAPLMLALLLMTGLMMAGGRADAQTTRATIVDDPCTGPSTGDAPPCTITNSEVPAPLWRTAPVPCPAQATLSMIMGPGYRCFAGDKIFQNFNDHTIPNSSNNFDHVPTNTIVRFASVPGVGIGIEFLSTSASGFPSNATNFDYNIAVAATPTTGSFFTRASLQIMGSGFGQTVSGDLQVRNNAGSGAPHPNVNGVVSSGAPCPNATCPGFAGIPLEGDSANATGLFVQNRINADPGHAEIITSLVNWWCESPDPAKCTATDEPTPVPTPEPGGLALFLLGLAGVGFASRRRSPLTLTPR